MKNGNSVSLEISELLKDRGLRSTAARIELLLLLKKSSQPLSAESICEGLQAKKVKADNVTVYRNLKSFESAGIVLAVDLGTGRCLYEYCPNRLHHHHHHVRCERCERIEHIDVCGLEAHLKMLEAMGYQGLKHRLEFTGICRNCA